MNAVLTYEYVYRTASVMHERTWMAEARKIFYELKRQNIVRHDKMNLHQKVDFIDDVLNNKA